MKGFCVMKSRIKSWKCFIVISLILWGGHCCVLDGKAVGLSPIPQENQKKKDLGVDEVKPYESFQLTRDTYEGRPFNYDDLPLSDGVQKLHILVYFSPTCHHCQNFFKSFPDLIENYIKPKKIFFYLRPYTSQNNPFDLVVSQLAMHKGDNSFVYYFSKFMLAAELWSPYIYKFRGDKTTDKDNEEKIKCLSTLVSSLGFSSDFLRSINSRLHESLRFYKRSTEEFDNDKMFTSLIFVALSFDISPEQINHALVGDNAEDVQNRLILTTLQALNEKNEPVAAIPAFYINSNFQKQSMNYDDLAKAIDGGILLKKNDD